MFKMKTAKIMTVLIVCLFLASCTTEATPTVRSDSATLSEERIEQIRDEEIYPDAPVSLVKHYQALSELYDDATIIIRGVLDDIEREKVTIDDNLPANEEFIYSTFIVEEAIKGSIEKGDQVTVRDIGMDEYVVGGIPLYDEDHSYILFLLESEGTNHVVGAFQGRFVIREGYAFQQTTEYAQLADYTPLKAAELVGQIRSR